MPKEYKFCKNCKHYKEELKVGASIQDFYKCIHPELYMVDLVSGERRYHNCADMRKDDFICGIDAKYYEEPLRRTVG